MSNLEQQYLRNGAIPATSQRASPIDDSLDDKSSVSSTLGYEESLASQPLTHSGRQTGVKGVQADANHQTLLVQQERHNNVNSANAQYAALSSAQNSQTWSDDQAKRQSDQAKDVDSDDEELKAIRQRRLDTLRGQAAANENRRRRLAGEGQDNEVDLGLQQCDQHVYGHLREIGPDQYAQAIDIAPSTFVVVHIYVKYVHACAMLTSALSQLARVYPSIKFLQVRAGSIAFGSGGGAAINDDQSLEVDEDTLDQRAEDVVPTLLVYRGGEIQANLVRVDLDEHWRQGTEEDICDLLKHYKVISRMQ